MKKEKSFNAVNLTRDFYKVHRRARGGRMDGVPGVPGLDRVSFLLLLRFSRRRKLKMFRA